MTDDEILKRAGWSPLWSEDNWIKNEWRKSKTINLDWAGVPKKIALAQARKFIEPTEEEIEYEKGYEGFKRID